MSGPCSSTGSSYPFKFVSVDLSPCGDSSYVILSAETSPGDRNLSVIGRGFDSYRGSRSNWLSFSNSTSCVYSGQSSPSFEIVGLRLCSN
jgi:hypothetical protein